MSKRKVKVCFVVVNPWSQLNGYGESYGRDAVESFNSYEEAEDFILNLDEKKYPKLAGRALAIDKLYVTK